MKVLLVGCSTTPSTQPTSAERADAVKKNLLRLNREIWEPLILKNDPTLFLKHSHEHFLVIAPGGIVEDREEAAAGARAFSATGVSISDEQVHIIGTTAVVIGKLDIDGEVRPLGRPGPMKFMAVFAQHNSEWKLLARPLTPCHRLAIERGRCYASDPRHEVDVGTASGHNSFAATRRQVSPRGTAALRSGTFSRRTAAK